MPSAQVLLRYSDLGMDIVSRRCTVEGMKQDERWTVLAEAEDHQIGVSFKGWNLNGK